ncbi:MAG: YggS family pyridoxal phosphate-dependent enzyme [Actinomycetota bacterium]
MNYYSLSHPDARTLELSQRLDHVNQRVARACQTAGRSPDDITVIVVTKTFPPDDVRRLISLGIRDVAENRDQEAAQKAELIGKESVRWHFVGQLQRNKVNSVARYANVIHSVDRAPLVRSLDHARSQQQAPLQVLIQVDLDEDKKTHRGGALATEVMSLADQIAKAHSLQLQGLMAVAPRGSDPDAAFSYLRLLSEQLRDVHPQAQWISAGMSADIESAVTHGATHLRVGSAVLGSRPVLQ